MAKTISEKEFLSMLEEAIESIRETYQINSTGIEMVLRRILTPEDKELNFGGQAREVYTKVLEFYKGINSSTNKYGALSRLEKIKKEYSHKVPV